MLSILTRTPVIYALATEVDALSCAHFVDSTVPEIALACAYVCSSSNLNFLCNSSNLIKLHLLKIFTGAMQKC